MLKHERMKSSQLELPNHKSMLIAVCRENNGFQASMKGHGSVYPFAQLIFIDNLAFFYRDNREVWFCSRRYAESHFTIVEKPALSDSLGNVPTLEKIVSEAS